MRAALAQGPRSPRDLRASIPGSSRLLFDLPFELPHCLSVSPHNAKSCVPHVTRRPRILQFTQFETIEKLRLRGIGFRSLTEAIDTTTAQGVLVFHMFSALAEFERALIRERTRAGLAAAKRAGRTGGRPPKLSEDDLDVARTLLANPDITVSEIAERIGVSSATLYRYIPTARTANARDA